MNIFLKFKKSDTSFVTAVIDSFEGVAAARTPNPDKAAEFSTLHCMVSPDQIKVFNKIVADLSKKIKIERLP